MRANAQHEVDQMRSEAQKAVVAQRQTVDLELTNSREEDEASCRRTRHAGT